MNIDGGGFQMSVYGNKAAKTPNIDNFVKRAVTIKHDFTSVSSCSPSRSALLTGMYVSVLAHNILPQTLKDSYISRLIVGLSQHQNGIYGLQHLLNHFQSFDEVQSLPQVLNKTGGDYW